MSDSYCDTCRYCGLTDLRIVRGLLNTYYVNVQRQIHTCLAMRKANAKPLRRYKVGLQRSKAYYVTDRGDSHQLDEMKVSHLLNAINHHRKQIDTIDWVLEDSASYRNYNNVHRRRMALHATTEALVVELLTRDPDKDNEEYPDY